MSGQKDEPNMMGMCTGMAVIIIFFFGGFISMFTFDIFEMGVGMILFFMMGIPMIGFLLGAAIIIKSNPRSTFTRGFMGGGLFAPRYERGGQTVERNFIHEPPAFCSGCGGSITSEDIEWVGPLSVKCPYCGVTLPTSKREI
ncbi:MAG: hypothetical protein P1Q69_18405 [Candidatus Thorarchaeota archaeon]|nr:hypothetical protein [Candidatus Thorarchaeota archaeon]